MTPREFVERVATRRRAPLIAALVALIAALPTLFTLPPTDRDESRFAEASAQMLESGDFSNIMFQDQPRYKKPVGIYWLQALSVKALSAVERREIWAYRVPSVLGAMLAAAACAWGALAFLGPGEALMAGLLLASTLVLSTESTLATTDAALCGAVTLSLAAMGRVYLAGRGGPPAGRWTLALFWLGLGASVLLKGPIGPMAAALTGIALALWDRRTGWIGKLGWDWGLILLAAMVLPWALAITVATDGAFWGAAVGGDLAPKLAGGQEGHGAPPGYFLLLSPVLLFPATLLLPAAAAEGWTRRVEPGVRFALCWLVPTWIVFEFVPTKLPHYTLPTFGALAWLMAASLRRPPGPLARWIGAGLTLLVAVGLAIAGAAGAWRFGDAWSWAWAALAGVLLAAAAILGAARLLGRRAGIAAALACGFGVAAHAALAGALAPSLQGIWLSERVARSLSRTWAAEGGSAGPVSVAGYAEPSLVFLLGAPTVLGSPADAAEAIAEGRAAVVDDKAASAFQAALAADQTSARQTDVVRGLNYSSGHAQTLRLYEPGAAPEAGR
jgi:4-amino-4-deoxy-L-arabinose transferase-like glycosyltransferase